MHRTVAESIRHGGSVAFPSVGAGDINYTQNGQTINRRNNIVANRKTLKSPEYGLASFFWTGAVVGTRKRQVRKR